MWRLAVFGLVLVGMSLGTHAYLYRRLVVDPQWPRWARRVGGLALAAGAIGVPTAMFFTRSFEREAVAPLPLIFLSWMGFVFYLVLTLGAIDLARWLGRRVRGSGTSAGAAEEAVAAEGEGGTALVPHDAPGSTPAASRSGEPAAALPRRVFVRRAAALGALGASGAVGLWGVRKALGEFETPEIQVPLSRLPRALDGVRVALLSDIHVGPLVDRRFVRTIVERTNALRPDLVAITGDLVDGSVPQLGDDVAALMGLRSRWGTYFVTGNHEYYSGAAAWIEALEGMGISVLGNRRVSIGDPDPRGASFDLLGVHDRHASRWTGPLAPDFDLTFTGRDAEREAVLLAHQPKDIHEAVHRGVGLQLSGHTHGGQLWPFGGAAALVQPYVAGLYEAAPDTRIYVTRGTGFWGPPMRVLAPAEISLIVLRSA